MKLTISRPSAIAAAFVAAAARLFLALCVGMGSPHNGAWLSALLGALPVVPWLLCVDGLRKAKPDPRAGRLAPLFVVLALATFWDASTVLSAVTRSASYLAPQGTPPLLFALPAVLAALWCVTRNGDAVGYGAMLWARLFPGLLALVVLLQARHYKPGWLFPLLGSGWRGVVSGGIGSAGWMMPASAVLLTAEDEPANAGKARWRAALPASAAVVAAMLVALSLMMTPAQLRGDGWLHRLDALLTNGRAPLYLQLPMIVCWYAGLFHLLTCEGFACAALIQRLAPGLDGRICACAVALGTVLLSLVGLSELGERVEAAYWLYIAVAVLTALCAAAANHGKGGAKGCA